MAADEPAAKRQRAEETPRVVFVLGGPGAGKSTQSQKVLDNFKGWAHISAGDCLRDEKNDPNSKDGELIKNYIKEGQLVPIAITIKLLQKAMAAKMKEGKTGFLIDGFPRNMENVEGWKECVGEAALVCGVLFLECEEAVMQARLLERAKTSGRDDDNLESIAKRFKTFLGESMPVLNQYKQGTLLEGKVFHIDGNKPIEEVWVHVKAAIHEAEGVGMDPMELRQQIWSAGGLRQTAGQATFRVGSSLPRFRLRYFVIRGLVELPQLLLEEAGASYEIELLGYAEFKASKTAQGPFGRMPLLINYDGKGSDLAQSGAITRFLAPRVGLAGADDFERAAIDMVFMQLGDTMGNPEQFSKAALSDAAGVPVPQFRDVARVNDLSLCQKSLASLQCFDELLQKNGTGFLVGKAVSYADLSLFLRLFDLDEEGPDLGSWKWADSFPELAKFFAAMGARPNIKAFLESPKRMPQIAPPDYQYIPGKLCPKP